MNPLAAFLLGLWLGCMLGFALAAILAVGSRADQPDE